MFNSGKGGVVLSEINRLLDKTRTKLAMAESLKRSADSATYAQELRELEAQKNVYVGSAEDIADILKHELDAMALTTKKSAATKKTTKKTTSKKMKSQGAAGAATTKPSPRARVKARPAAKPKPKTKARAKNKAKAKADPKTKAKAKTESKAKAEPKPK